MRKETASMTQLHRIRERLYEEERRLSVQERVAKIHREADAILKAWGMNLKRASPPSRAVAH